MIVYSHPDCLLKFNGQGHPERKERLESIISSIKSSNLEVEFKQAPLADLETVSLVHPKQHIEQIKVFQNFSKMLYVFRCFPCKSFFMHMVILLPSFPMIVLLFW